MRGGTLPKHCPDAVWGTFCKKASNSEKPLFERVATNWEHIYESYNIKVGYVQMLKLTNLDYKSILRSNLDNIKSYRKESDEEVQWLLKEIGDN